MTNFLGMLAFNTVLFFSLILSLPTSALAQQEVDPTYYDPVPAQTVVAKQAAKPAAEVQAAKQASNNQQPAKAKKQAGRKHNAQQLIAKK
jgi:hypothetical protein